MPNIVAASDEQTRDGDGIGDIQQDNASCNHTVESGDTPQIQQPQHANDKRRDEMCTNRYIDSGIDMAQELMKRQSSITRKTPTQSRLPRLTRDQTPNPRCDEQSLEDDSATATVECLVEECEDGD